MLPPESPEADEIAERSWFRRSRSAGLLRKNGGPPPSSDVPVLPSCERPKTAKDPSRTPQTAPQSQPGNPKEAQRTPECQCTLFPPSDLWSFILVQMGCLGGNWCFQEAFCGCPGVQVGDLGSVGRILVVLGASRGHPRKCPGDPVLAFWART